VRCSKQVSNLPLILLQKTVLLKELGDPPVEVATIAGIARRRAAGGDPTCPHGTMRSTCPSPPPAAKEMPQFAV